MTDRAPLVSIITLNFNQLKTTCEFIESTKRLTYSAREIIVVDNGSRNKEGEALLRLNPDVKVILNEENIGFSGGNNIGIHAAKGEYLFIVNNDTEVTPDLLERLLKPFETDPAIGVVCPKIRYFSHPDRIQYAGYTPINPLTGRNKAIGCGEMDKGQYDKPRYTAYAHGAAMMVKREIIEKVGLLPDVFFIYYEELDWSEQIRNAGYRIYYEPKAVIFHKESMTVGKRSAVKTYYHTRNRILFMRRNTSRVQFALFSIFLLLVVAPKNLCVYFIKGEFEHIKSFIKALWWNILPLNT